MKTFPKVQNQGTSQLKIRYVECQILKVGREIDMGVVSQKAQADTKSPTPIQIDEPNPVIRVGERSMVQDSCQPTSYVENNNEDTRPLRTRHWAQKQEERAEQTTQKQEE